MEGHRRQQTCRWGKPQKTSKRDLKTLRAQTMENSGKIFFWKNSTESTKALRSGRRMSLLFCFVLFLSQLSQQIIPQTTDFCLFVCLGNYSSIQGKPRDFKSL